MEATDPVRESVGDSLLFDYGSSIIDFPAAKRSRLSPSNSEDPSGATAPATATATVIPSTTLKITSQKQGTVDDRVLIFQNYSANSSDGQPNDSSMVVSMEINGVTYQGVLFALRADPSSDS